MEYKIVIIIHNYSILGDWRDTSFLILLPKKASQDMVCASNLYSPNQPE